MTKEATRIAREIGEKTDSDIFVYNGGIERSHILSVIEQIYSEKQNKNLILLLVTQGGDPDAAYKLARYFQDSYEKFTLLVSGTCKSAGTLIAVGAHEVGFSPYGELGPVDTQIYKVDNIAERQSGLTIIEALENLVATSVKKHGETFSEIIKATGAVISFQTAAKAAADLVNGLMSPIFAQIDPYDVGDKARAMRIAAEYGRRLDVRTQNLQEEAIEALTRTYPSHSFVIDKSEAELLFKNVRELAADEQKLVAALGGVARDELDSNKPIFLCLTSI